MGDQTTMPSEMDYDAKHELRYSYVDVYRMLSKVVPLPRIAHLEAEAQQREAIIQIIDGDLRAAMDAGRRGRYDRPEATVNACEQCGADGDLIGSRPMLCPDCSQHSEGPPEATVDA